MPGLTRSFAELVTRTRWYVNLRWFILILVIVPSLAASYLDVGFGARFMRDLIFCVVALLSNCVFHILTYTLKKTSGIKLLAYILVVADVILVTGFLHSKGGIESRSIILYILPMVAASAILGRRGTYLTTLLSIVGFTFIIFGAYFGWLGAPLSQYTPGLDNDLGYVINTVVFFDFVLLVVAVAMDYMLRLLIQREQESKQALEQMRQAQLIAKTGTWEFDAITQSVHYSDELRTVMGDIIEDSSLPADEFLKLVHQDDRAMVRRQINAALKKPKTYSFEHRMLARDGSIRYLHVDGRSLTDNEGAITHIIGSARDITDEKALQKARNDFVALASHQLRTPATIVKQYVGMLKDGYVGSVPEEQQHMLNIAYETNERQLKIVNDLLNVARIDSNSYKINRRKTDLTGLVAVIVRDQTSKFATKEQRLLYKRPAVAVVAKIDADAFRMAIDNLLDNAHKYTPGGKSVRVSVQKVKRTVVVSIIDRGVGIAKSDVPKMFKLFSRVENPMILQQEGTGLGLYWADRIIRLHHGKITVASEVGRGTTFTITMPL